MGRKRRGKKVGGCKRSRHGGKEIHTHSKEDQLCIKNKNVYSLAQIFVEPSAVEELSFYD